MREPQDVILGGGLSGMTAAYYLQMAGEDHWQLYEKEEQVGGHARSIAVDGYLFDYGPHIHFTIDAEMESLIRDLLGDNLHAQERRAFIYHHAYDLYTRFPFQAHLYGLPVPIVKECLPGGLLH
jgi:protoporphyrinogen oxidase